jgi:malate dehydrogenase (oxaloacetate-decarboxylating)(NADP+)
MRIARFSLRIKPIQDFAIVNPERDDRYREYWKEYYRLMARRGVTIPYAKLELRRRTTLIAAMLLKKGEGDGMICGSISTTSRHLRYIDQVLGRAPDTKVYAAMNRLILPHHQVFIVDTHVNADPDPGQLAEITKSAAKVIQRFGLHPKIALLSHSNFGSHDTASSQKMRATLRAS